VKRFLVLFMVLGLMAGAVATAEAKKKKPKPKPEPTRVERTVEASYLGPQVLYEYRPCAPSAGAGCVTLETRANEGFLTANVTDAHGQPVSVYVVDTSEARYDLDGPSAIYGTFCGKTTEPIRFDPGTTLELWVGGQWWPTEWGPTWFVPKPPRCAPAIGTTGTISVTLSNLP
jgi:hypothetical protein